MMSQNNILIATIDATNNNPAYSEIVGFHGMLLDQNYKDISRIEFKVEPVNPDRYEDVDYDFKRIDIAMMYLNSWLYPHISAGVKIASWNGEFTRQSLLNACLRNNVLWLFEDGVIDVYKLFKLWNVKHNNDTRDYCISDAMGIVTHKSFKSNTIEGVSLKTAGILKGINN